MKDAFRELKLKTSKVKAQVEDLKETEITQGKYTLIIAAWVLNFLRKTEVCKIVDKIKDGLKKDGLVYVGAFSTSDPGYQRAKKTLKEVEENTFYSEKRKSFIHCFTRNEIASLFNGFRIICFVEGTGLDIEHGEPHYHGLIEYVGQRAI